MVDYKIDLELETAACTLASCSDIRVLMSTVESYHVLKIDHTKKIDVPP